MVSEQGESQRRGWVLNENFNSPVDLTEGVTANNHFDRIFEKIALQR